MTEVSVIIRCRYCGSEIKIDDGKLMKPPRPTENTCWAGQDAPKPKNIRISGICDAHEIGSEDSSVSFAPAMQKTKEVSTDDVEREHEIQE
jgi:hypothetical protein